MAIYYAIILYGFGITIVVTLLYGFIAPWYKSDTGKSFFGLLAALSLLMINSALRIAFDKADWTTVIGVTIFAIYGIALTFLGGQIYNAQVRRHRKKKVKS